MLITLDPKAETPDLSLILKQLLLVGEFDAGVSCVDNLRVFDHWFPLLYLRKRMFNVAVIFVKENGTFSLFTIELL